MDAIDTAEDLELEQTAEETAEDGCEVIDHEAEDTAAGFDDHLSEVVQKRLRNYLPRHVVAAGTNENGYCEVLIERPEIVNGELVDKISAALLDADLADKAQAVTGNIATEFVGTDQLLELSYRLVEDTGFIYTITLDGKYVKSFRNSGLAQLVFTLVVDHKLTDLGRLVGKICGIYHNLAATRGEDKLDTCSEDFLQEVSYWLSRHG